MPNETYNKPKVVYVTSRTGDHPIHIAYADSLNSDYQYIDFKLPWHATNSSRLKKYLSWFVCALTFPNKDKYDIFIVSGQHVMPALMKLFFQFRKTQKLVCLHANEGLYFVHSKKYKWLNRKLIKFSLSKYDAHICIGNMQTNLLKKITKNQEKNIFTITNGIYKDKHNQLIQTQPNLSSKNILFIGHLYAGWRTWYKGIDLMINSVKELISEGEDITFKIIGKYTDEFKDFFDKNVPLEIRNRIILAGSTNDIASEFTNSSLYLHCSRGDAFPTTTMEAITAGLPCIVSENTGTLEIIEQINPNLIVKCTTFDIKKVIKNYFLLDLKEKREISKRAKEISREYILEEKIESFKSTIEKISKL